MSEINKTLVDAWDDPQREWPTVAYIETTNHCNANCLCCLNDRCQKPRGTMTMETFKKVVAKLQERNLQISAMFCFGEPLLDPTLFDKYAYARSKNAMRVDHCGLNTNVSKLTQDRYEGIFRYTPNITLSFYNVGAEYERLTKLNWNQSYTNAMQFIRHRDKYVPEYPIAIGVNTIEGYNTEAVKQAFEGYSVNWVCDAEIRWGGCVITGVIDRTIMYPWWSCDGYKGAIQIKHDGACEFCAYDVVGSPAGGETHIGNILTDSWDTIETNFRAKWKSGCSLCKRCDYWHKAKEIWQNEYKRPDPLPDDWYDWQKPYLAEGEAVKD